MMISKQTLLDLADRYMAERGDVSETTLSHRIFGDTKKLRAMRGRGDITLTRFNGAMIWFRRNWPEGAKMPDVLAAYPADQTKGAA